jgi:hypothetical protein
MKKGDNFATQAADRIQKEDKNKEPVPARKEVVAQAWRQILQVARCKIGKIGRYRDC